MDLRANVGFVVTNTFWLSRTIAWFLKGPFSHTFFCANNIQTVETDSLSVHYDVIEDHMTNPNKSCEIYAPINLSEEEIVKICQNAKSTLGLRYGYLKFANEAVSLLLSRVGINFPIFMKGTLCYDVNLTAFKDSHLKELKDLKLDTEKLRQAIINSPNFKLVFKR